jgi:t-SNARE complex subunit (syntaxin)
MSKAGHGGAVACHVAVASELSTHGATQGGVVGEEASVVHVPHKFLLVSELNVGECGVFLWNVKSAPSSAARARRAPCLVVCEVCVCVCVCVCVWCCMCVHRY